MMRAAETCARPVLRVAVLASIVAHSGFVAAATLGEASGEGARGLQTPDATTLAPATTLPAATTAAETTVATTTSKPASLQDYVTAQFAVLDANLGSIKDNIRNSKDVAYKEVIDNKRGDRVAQDMAILVDAADQMIKRAEDIRKEARKYLPADTSALLATGGSAAADLAEAHRARLASWQEINVHAPITLGRVQVQYKQLDMDVEDINKSLNEAKGAAATAFETDGKGAAQVVKDMNIIIGKGEQLKRTARCLQKEAETGDAVLTPSLMEGYLLTVATKAHEAHAPLVRREH